MDYLLLRSRELCCRCAGGLGDLRSGVAQGRADLVELEFEFDDGSLFTVLGLE
jgi:hypothetical protein